MDSLVGSAVLVVRYHFPFLGTNPFAYEDEGDLWFWFGLVERKGLGRNIPCGRDTETKP